VQTDLVRRFAEKSLVALPLLASGEPIGAVVIDDTRRPRTWGSSEVERAELIATQVATAVANARLFEEVKQSYERLARAQEELVKRERLAALGQLAATLAHEVRNPLGVLFNSLGTLGKMMPNTGDAAVLLRIMGEEARRLDRLVRELLDFARPVTPALEPHSLAEVVDGALSAATQQLGAESAALSSEISAEFPRMSLDHAMMRRALVNLLVNGAQAAGSAGAVVIRSSIETRSGRQLARIEVSDNGPGIPPAIAQRVFEPFFTTKATGTGLGLAIVKSIVEAHGGQIELAAADRGVGTRATLLLPLDTDAELAS
jgi:signal transduction histidine kinase